MKSRPFRFVFFPVTRLRTIVIQRNVTGLVGHDVERAACRRLWNVDSFLFDTSSSSHLQATSLGDAQETRFTVGTSLRFANVRLPTVECPCQRRYGFTKFLVLLSDLIAAAVDGSSGVCSQRPMSTRHRLRGDVTEARPQRLTEQRCVSGEDDVGGHNRASQRECGASPGSQRTTRPKAERSGCH